MVKPLSEKLSEMSARAKKAEDNVAAAKQEAHEKVAARREQSRAAVEAAINKVDQNIKSVEDATADKWRALQAKIAADVAALKARSAERHHDRDVRQAEDRANVLEWEASLAIDYALVSIEQAELAMFDAITSRIEAERTKSS